MAEQVGYSTPYRLQHLLDERSGMQMPCAEIRQYAVEHLKSETDILAIDETGFQAGRAISRRAGTVLRYDWTFGELPGGCVYVLYQ